MSKPERPIFQLVNTNTDYIEFTVTYYLGEDRWVVDGIGWIDKGIPSYYLRKLRLNGFPATGEYYEKAKLVLKNSSFKFKSRLLHDLALSNVDQFFSTTVKREFSQKASGR